MEEQKSQQTTDEAQGTAQQAPPPRTDLKQELRDLAETLEQAVRGLTNSEQTKEIEQELRNGVSTLRQQAESALHEAKLQEAAQEFSTQAKRVAQEAAQGQFAQQALMTITRGLQALNQQLEKLINTSQSQRTEGQVMPDMPSPPVDQAMLKSDPEAKIEGK